MNSLVISCSFISAEVTRFRCGIASQFWAIVSEVNTTEGYMLCKLDYFTGISTTEKNCITTSEKIRPTREISGSPEHSKRNSTSLRALVLFYIFRVIRASLLARWRYKDQHTRIQSIFLYFVHYHTKLNIWREISAINRISPCGFNRVRLINSLRRLWIKSNLGFRWERITIGKAS